MGLMVMQVLESSFPHNSLNLHRSGACSNKIIQREGKKASDSGFQQQEGQALAGLKENLCKGI